MKDVKITTGIVEAGSPKPAAAPVSHAEVAAAHGLSEPSASGMAKNLSVAAARWISAGFPVVGQEIYDARTAACAGCEYWDGKARLGLGKCRAPGCGCTGLKRWLATETCPHPAGSRWPLDKPGNK